MKLHDLKPAEGASTPAFRKGRGHGSGNGKTAGYGHKGQKARSVVDAEALKAAGLVKKTLDGVKVLGNGELTKALTVKAAAYTASAKEKIEKAGGKAEVI